MKRLFIRKMTCFLFFLSACTITDNHYLTNYQDVPTSNYLLWASILDKNNQYYAYIFQNQCHVCNEIKAEVMSFYFNHQDNFYFIEYSSNIPLTNDPYQCLNKKRVSDLAIKGVPTLFLIDNHTVYSLFVGGIAIKEHIKSMSSY